MSTATMGGEISGTIAVPGETGGTEEAEKGRRVRDFGPVAEAAAPGSITTTLTYAKHLSDKVDWEKTSTNTIARFSQSDVMKIVERFDKAGRNEDVLTVKDVIDAYSTLNGIWIVSLSNFDRATKERLLDEQIACVSTYDINRIKEFSRQVFVAYYETNELRDQNVLNQHQMAFIEKVIAKEISYEGNDHVWADIWRTASEKCGISVPHSAFEAHEALRADVSNALWEKVSKEPTIEKKMEAFAKEVEKIRSLSSPPVFYAPEEDVKASRAVADAAVQGTGGLASKFTIKNLPLPPPLPKKAGVGGLSVDENSFSLLCAYATKMTREGDTWIKWEKVGKDGLSTKTLIENITAKVTKDSSMDMLMGLWRLLDKVWYSQAGDAIFDAGDRSRYNAALMNDLLAEHDQVPISGRFDKMIAMGLEQFYAVAQAYDIISPEIFGLAEAAYIGTLKYDEDKAYKLDDLYLNAYADALYAFLDATDTVKETESLLRSEEPVPVEAAAAEKAPASVPAFSAERVSVPGFGSPMGVPS